MEGGDGPPRVPPAVATGASRAALSLADEAHRAAGRGDPEGALINFQKAALIAQSEGDPGSVARCLVDSAEVLASIGEFHEARKYLERARDLAKDRALEALKGEVYRGYGALYKARGMLQEAAVCYDRALERLEYTGDQVAVRQTLVGLSEVYLRLGRHAQARHLLERAEGMGPHADETLGVRVRLNRGRLAHSAGDLPGAIAEYESARAEARAGNRPFDRELVALGLSGLYFEAGRTDDALAEIREGLALSIVAFAREPVRPLERSRFKAMGERLAALSASLESTSQAPDVARRLEEAVRLHNAHPLVLTGDARPLGPAPPPRDNPGAGAPAAVADAYSQARATVGPTNLRTLK